MSRSPMTDDPTARAREALRAAINEHFNATDYGGADEIASDFLLVFAEHGVGFIDTRTHVAIAREPSEADVERVARAIYTTGMPDVWDDLSEGSRDDFREEARAAIAALVQQGGGE